jgi:hypothetical protein
VRALAEEGKHAPLIGGGFLVLFGVLLSIGYTLQWLLLTGKLDDLGGGAFGMLWLCYGVLALIGSVWLAMRIRRKPGISSLINKVDRLMWRASGFAIGAVVIGCIARTIMNDDYQAPNAIMAAAFALFAVPLGTTAAISNHGWMGWFSAISMVVSVLLWAFLNEPWAYLIAAAASLSVLALPGFILMRREPSEVV